MKRIAIVDDEIDILESLEKFLLRSGKFEVEIFSNSSQALDNVKHGTFDLLLLDIMMPQLDGMSFLKEVKNSNTSIKVIMMTAFSTQDKIVECRKLGAEDYVTKPFISLRDVENKILDNLGL